MVNEVVENHEVSGSISNGDKKTLSDFFPSVQAMVDKVTWYMLLEGGDKYVVELVEVHKIWPGHHYHLKK